MAAPPIRVLAAATGELLAEVPDEGAAGVAVAVEAARSAAPAWAALPVPARAEALEKWRDLVLDEVSLVAETLAAESGKPRHETEVFEIVYLCELIRFACRAARRALSDETRNPLLFLTKKTHRGADGDPPAAGSRRAPHRKEAGLPVRPALSRSRPPRDAAALSAGNLKEASPPVLRMLSRAVLQESGVSCDTPCSS